MALLSLVYLKTFHSVSIKSLCMSAVEDE